MKRAEGLASWRCDTIEEGETVCVTSSRWSVGPNATCAPKSDHISGRREYGTVRKDVWIRWKWRQGKDSAEEDGKAKSGLMRAKGETRDRACGTEWRHQPQKGLGAVPSFCRSWTNTEPTSFINGQGAKNIEDSYRRSLLCRKYFCRAIVKKTLGFQRSWQGTSGKGRQLCPGTWPCVRGTIVVEIHIVLAAFELNLI